MPKLWLNENKLVLADNQLTICDTCPCTGTVTHECTNCSNNEAPDEVEVVVGTGGGDALCAYCTSKHQNATFVLPWFGVQASECIYKELWNNLVSSPHCGGNNYLAVHLGIGISGVNVTVYPGMVYSGYCRYTGEASDFDCLNLNYAVPYDSGSSCTCYLGSTVTVRAR